MTNNSIPGFADPNAKQESDDSGDETTTIKRKNPKKSGGFQSMGLNYNILKGIMKRGYKQPTPIQRKAIPLVLENRDIVAMARTGSGKTACFIVPMFEKLKARSAKSGARALIFSPTRELALQTLRFVKDLGRFLNFKAAVILGGDSMDEQFAAIHGNPDIIVATPGRFLHVCMEMELKLNSIEYVVFDEADRLFEMGLGEQLAEILARLPDARQTVLFSATLPKVLVEFSRAGLSDPVLIRLDVESKIPPELNLHYIVVRAEEKVAALLVLLKSYIDNDQQTVVFAATKHHVEYLHMILDHIGIANTYIYSNLDPSARKINAAKFSMGKAKVLVVTDVAARGIDIPQLDNVINFNFPAKPKLFVHRVGRCARAGRSGTAYSLVTTDEYAYLLDLHLFLGRPLTIATPALRDGNIGRMPRNLVEEQHSTLLTLHENHIDLSNMLRVSDNGYQQYLRSRPAASSDSNKRIKDLPLSTCSIHPIFKGFDDGCLEMDREDFLDQMKSYRPHGTIFEICGKNKSQEYLVMKEKRLMHKEKISKHHEIVEEKQNLLKLKASNYVGNSSGGATPESQLVTSNADEINDVFNEVILPKKRKLENLYKLNKRQKRRDENYISYLPADTHTEDGLAVNNFNKEANKVQFDITGDSEDTMKRSSHQKKMWDRKKKKMVAVPDKRAGKIRTESGAWIPATYKSNRYAQWKEKSKAAASGANDDNDDNDDKSSGMTRGRRNNNTHWAKHNEKVKLKQKQSELKSNDQILKARKLAEKKRYKQSKKGRNKGKKSRK